MNLNSNKFSKNKALFYWLTTLTIMCFFMILIGGLTRLTNSGLSMVNWNPIMGTIPPLSLEKWMIAFNQYKSSPEFIIVNKNMNLNEFKNIFWWEWFHRFFARCIGMVFILPMIFFIITKKISNKLMINLFILLLFGIFQALVGWWMVKSGLNNNPYVSSYRLAFHLSNAVIIISILFWLSLNSFSLINIRFIPTDHFDYNFIIVILLLFITIISGAFMAGSDAGKSFNTYPLMNGSLIPDDYFIEDLGFNNFFENTIAINFNHRWLASFTFIVIILFAIYMFLKNEYNNFKYQIILVFLFSIMQFLLGIGALISNVKIYLASLHQINSMLLLGSILFTYHSIKKERYHYVS